ncbi:hypothetical protein [Bacillus sp. B1-b2]|nr:hypothetical protein [Bacillus sp. B1-b2]
MCIVAVLFLFLFTSLYQHQLGSIGYFIISIYFFLLAKKQYSKQKELDDL